MSRDWTPEEIQAASAAMKKAGQMSYEEVAAEIAARAKLSRFADIQSKYHFPCPRCGKWAMDEKPTRNALSRRFGVYICDQCGTLEALEDATGERLPLASWDIAKKKDWPL